MTTQENLFKPSLHPQFTKETSGQYYDFWYHTWGHGQDKQKVDQLPPSSEEPAITYTLRGILVFSEYERFLKDLEDMLNGTAGHFSTEVRSDPSSWDSWNEMERMEWRDYTFWDEDGSEIVDEEYASLRALAPDEPEVRVIPQVVQVIGQPGIGKSLLLYFILAKRLLQSKATFLHSAPDVVLYFCSDGVYRFKPPMSTDRWQYELTEKDGHWVYTPIRIIESASPIENRLDWARKLARPKLRWFMRPMSLKEFLLAATLQESHPNPGLLRAFYREFGPNARAAYVACIHPVDYWLYIREVEGKIGTNSSDQLRTTFYSAAGLVYDNAITHSVFLVTAGPRRSECRTGFVSRYIYELVSTQYSSDRGRIIDMFFMFHQDASTHASAGYLFEDFMHQILEKGACLEMRVMSGTKTGKGKNVIFRPDFDKPTESLKLAPSATAHLYGHDEEVLRPGLYCKPPASDAVTLDSYYWDQARGIIWLFQFTVSEYHNAKQEGTKWIMDRAEKQATNAKINYVALSPSDHLRLAIPVPSPHSDSAPRSTSGSSRTFDGVYHVYICDFMDRAKQL
ncbi:hypothetical protein K435DRAFT_786516 [Dendrothele bispora CBS 962.96]|uniref:Uncharacterized protein n=1 Tax=Dendrothele bispora (strain CBS 962.96) TaxID=1314807 RepID=A0A4S8KQA2_DENBC|nr:hypothetical protein K435DRAFT_786516 [Dendrothele bispora CBS 962.96]